MFEVCLPGRILAGFTYAGVVVGIWAFWERHKSG
jgi:hypothetical protein